MEKFEHLFSQDPIGAFNKIEDDYARYFEVTYKLSNKELDEMRKALLRKDNNLSKEPYIEILPEYAPAEGVRTMEDLIKHFSVSFGEEKHAQQYFEKFISKGLMLGLMDKYIPYGHQIGMLEKAFAGIDENGAKLKYKNTVITSGTGSGKTESFLLPLLADIYKEYVSENWKESNSCVNWYEGVLERRARRKRYVPKQREGDMRPAAIRALVLYPMNALVEDQMARLREALDSDGVRRFMEDSMRGNRIYFGSYNGSTMAKKSYDLLQNYLNTGFAQKKEEVAKQLDKVHKHFEDIIKYVEMNPDKKEALYIEPRLGGNLKTGEMITRWDMQKFPPDILITNTSMLSIMLMRRAESPMFEATKKWLAAEDLPENNREEAKKNRIFHVVVDELHLYRGTAGSEVACLLRMLYNALGLQPVVNDGLGHRIPNPQIKILASSASLGNEDDTQKFLEEFFGLYSTIEGENVFNVQTGSNYTGIDDNIKIDYTQFKEFTHENFIAIEVGSTDDNEVATRRNNKVSEFIKKHFDCESVADFCKQYERQIFWDFYKVLPSNADGSKRPIAQSQLVKKLFGNQQDALRGFLIFRGYIDTVNSTHKLPRFRFHKFFKYIEGLWGELQPSLSKDTPPVSKLSYVPKEMGARKVLELLRCENCGQLFIGGNRKREADGSVSLTLNSPNLEQIPNSNPTPMVQNKTYKEYAIFWPTDINHGINIHDSDDRWSSDHVVVISTGDHTYANGEAEWEPGYLDALTGKFIPRNQAFRPNTNEIKEIVRTNGIQGFLYKVVNHDRNRAEINDQGGSAIYAAPCTCPYCLQDYTSRKYTNSPIRSFRTGIDRSNQLLSKELLYQLDAKSAKLIGFSDSREDAAKQALGIEKEQYRDMVRMLFVECADEIGQREIDEIKSFVEEEKERCGDDFNEKLQILSKAQIRFPNVRDAVKIATDVLSGKDVSMTSIVPLSDFVGAHAEGRLVKKLLQIGINPAGEAYKFQWYKKGDNDNRDCRLHHWSTAYDFNTCKMVDDPNFRDNEYERKIKDQLKNAIFANSFGKYMGVSVLDAGVGYICGPQSQEVQESPEYECLKSRLDEIDVYEFVDAFIRVMGDNYMYPSRDVSSENAASNYQELKAAVKRPIRKLHNDKGIDEDSLGDALVNYLKRWCTNDNLSLDLSKLSFAMMTKDKYIKCPKCGRVHPNLGFGFCTNTCCMTELDSTKLVDTEELHEHFISFDILKEKKAPRRLHTEELTGQTDDIQSRLREFKDLILDGDDTEKLGFKKTRPIDMICVTTTMEVGVDIGSLQAIFQGNMPPTRYNYQQRVGRGGRRGQAFSTAFTFCRGRSHDVYYYEKATDEMIGGIPATPKLSLAPYMDTNGTARMKIAIMKRMVVKEILHQAFLGLPYQIDLQDTAGEFGKVGEWENENKAVLTSWLNDHYDDVRSIVHRYFDQFDANGQIQSDIQRIINWIDKEMVQQIDNAVHKTSESDKGLASYLSETGFLPMYGMPSDSRNFYHGFVCVEKNNQKKYEIKKIDRSSEVAISEFAPGSEKTKDKGKYRVEGLTIPIKEDENSRRISFYDNEGDALADRYILSFDKNIGEEDNHITDITEALDNCPADETQLTNKQSLVVIPQAYRSFKIKGNTGTPVENNDKGSSFAQSRIFAHENKSSSVQTKRTVGNVDISIYELGLSDDPVVWHVNSNNNRFYKGSYHAENLGDPKGGHTNFMFFDEFSDNGTIKIRPKQEGTNIALGSKKVTEMIKLELKSYPDTLDLSLQTGNRSAIRAAFFSAAFLLQRALADKLDVQPDEIEICEKIDDNHQYPSMYLSDALPNGAGIVSYLYENDKLKELIKSIIEFRSFDTHKTSDEKSFMHALISDDHRRNCLTACQKCLLTYGNRGFHHVLDWRLGVGILQLMLDESYDFGFDASNRNRYRELEDFDCIIQVCAKKFNLAGDQGQYYWVNKNRGDCKVFYHPLWNREKVKENIPDNNDYRIKMYNTFKVLRSDLTEDFRENNTPIVRTRNILGRPEPGISTTGHTPTPPSSSNAATNDEIDPIL